MPPTQFTMKSIKLVAALALPLAACGSTPEAPEQASVSPNEPTEVMAETDMDAESMTVDPVERLEAAMPCAAQDIQMFQVFGLSTSSMASSSPETLSAVASALSQQDRETLVELCRGEEPDGFVLQRGTWMEVVGAGTEFIQFGGQDLDVELVTCEIVAAPDDRHVGQRVTMPIGWLTGRVVCEQ